MISLKKKKQNKKILKTKSTRAGNWSQTQVHAEMHFIILVVRSNYLKSTHTLTHNE